MQKWEYRVINTKSAEGAKEEELNRLGDEGWEVCGVVQTLIDADAIGEDGGLLDSGLEIILKRPKSN